MALTPMKAGTASGCHGDAAKARSVGGIFLGPALRRGVQSATEFTPVPFPGAPMFRNLRPWLPYIVFAAAVLLLTVVRSFHKTPTAAPPAPVTVAFGPLPSPPTEPAMLPAYLETVLRSRGMTVRVVPCKGRPDFYDLYAGERGDDGPLALVEVQPGESAPSFYLPGDYRVGPYHVVGNAALVMRVCQALLKRGGDPKTAPAPAV